MTRFWGILIGHAPYYRVDSVSDRQTVMLNKICYTRNARNSIDVTYTLESVGRLLTFIIRNEKNE